METIERFEHGMCTFALSGRVDTEGAIELDRALQTAVSEGRYKIVLDMAEVLYISSAGLRTLADIVVKSRAGGGDLKLVALSPKVMRVFRIIGFDRFFSIYDGIEEALDDF